MRKPLRWVLVACTDPDSGRVWQDSGMFRLRVGDPTADDHSALLQLVLSMACVARFALWQTWTAFRRLLHARLCT